MILNYQRSKKENPAISAPPAIATGASPAKSPVAPTLCRTEKADPAATCPIVDCIAAAAEPAATPPAVNPT